MNPGQLYELEINFFFNQVVARIRKLWKKGKKLEAEELYFDAMKGVSVHQHNKVLKSYRKLDEKGLAEFWEDIMVNGVYIHQPPFFGNMDFNGLVELYRKHDWVKPYKFEGIETPLVMGEMYFILLKHHPSTKLSIRSTSYLNIKNVPSKSTTFKENLQLYSKTPIRLGRANNCPTKTPLIAGNSLN